MWVLKNTKGILFALAISLFLLGGCTKPQTIETGKTMYSTQFEQSTMEYTIFLDKEITPITNALTTQILLIKHVVNDNYPLSDALDSAKSALDVISDCIEQVDTMNPPDSYEDLRVSVLKSMNNCKNDVETYIDELESGEIDKDRLDSLRKIMQADYIALTGDFQVQHQ